MLGTISYINIKTMLQTAVYTTNLNRDITADSFTCIMDANI